MRRWWAECTTAGRTILVALGSVILLYVILAATGVGGDTDPQGGHGGQVHSADDAYVVSRDACARLVGQKPVSVAVAGVDELVREWMASWNKDEGFPVEAEAGCRTGATRALAKN